MSNYLKGMQMDFDDGSLKRVAASKNPVEKLEFVEGMQPNKSDAEDDAIYICLDNKESDTSDSEDEFDSQNFGSLNPSRKAISDKGVESYSTK